MDANHLEAVKHLKELRSRLRELSSLRSKEGMDDGEVTDVIVQDEIEDEIGELLSAYRVMGEDHTLFLTPGKVDLALVEHELARFEESEGAPAA